MEKNQIKTAIAALHFQERTAIKDIERGYELAKQAIRAICDHQEIQDDTWEDYQTEEIRGDFVCTICGKRFGTTDPRTKQ
jgi:hypothetical protein